MTVKVINAACRAALRDMPEQSVNCIVTSPPYFGLRDYGNAAQIGLEQTPDAFVAELVGVFREAHRVLRDDGTLWLNLGDSYGATGGDTYSGFNERWSGTGGAGSKQNAALDGLKGRKSSTGLRPKNLIGIPWRVALALQADGWYLRQDIIWHKPNPMPESVKDRCTKAHEYVFLLSKSPRYYFDFEAIRDPGTYPSGTKAAKGSAERIAQKGVNSRPPEYKIYDGKRTKRSVWTVSTKPFSGAHFATFPPDLIEPCILAGCPIGGTVLDPFGGAGTTGMVADRHGRNAVLIELNSDYAEMARKRIADDAGLFTR